jgi:hypothetical protein
MANQAPRHAASAPPLSILFPNLAHARGQHEILVLCVHTLTALRERESLRSPHMNLHHTVTCCITCTDRAKQPCVVTANTVANYSISSSWLYLLQVLRRQRDRAKLTHY